MTCAILDGPWPHRPLLRDSGGIDTFGLDLSPRMVEQARELNPDIKFQVRNMMALDLRDESLAGIVAFYSIVNIPEKLPTAFAPEVEYQSRRAYMFARRVRRDYAEGENEQ